MTKSSNFQVMLDITPDHFTPNDRKLFQLIVDPDSHTPDSPITVYGYEYGWTIGTDGGRVGAMGGGDALDRTSEVLEWREEKVAAIKEASFSDAFVAILRHAWENDVSLIRIDRDANPEPGFPLFDEDTGDVYDSGEVAEETQPWKP